jgi:hypothetical protein
MLPPETYVPFNHSNREHINHIINVRWRRHRVTMICTMLAPLVLVARPMLCIFFYTVVIIFNLVYYDKRFGALRADRKRGEKLIIPFHPYPYCIPEVGRYYIKTNISIYPYITIDKETYMWMSSDQVLYMEVAPKSEIIFNISAEEVQNGTTIPMLKTPSQVRDRKRWN